MWIDRAAAVAAAEMAVAGQPLLAEVARDAARDGRPGSPLLVVRLDEADVGYYLIPWGTADGIGLLVRLDAATGDFLGVQEYAALEPSPLLDAARAAETARVALSAPSVGPPRCVWRPCRESTSPFRPFFEVPHSGGAVFVDMAGAVHRTLTPLGRGGS